MTVIGIMLGISSQELFKLVGTMNYLSFFLFMLAINFNDGAGIAEMISNYAKVRMDSRQNTTTIEKTTPTTTKPENATEEEPTPEYEDFDDDIQEPTRSGVSWDGQTIGKVIGGAISLLGLLQATPTKKSAAHGRMSKIVAEDRYNPTTATKKFKHAQGYYSGKTSYDSDNEQYQTISQPDGNKIQPDPMSYQPDSNDMQPYQNNQPAPAYYSWMNNQDDSSPQVTFTEPPKEKPYDFEQSDDNPENNQNQKPWDHHDDHRPKHKPKPNFYDPPDDFEEDIPKQKPKPSFYNPPEDDHLKHKPAFWNPHNHDLLYEDHPEEHPEEDEDRESKRPYSYYFLGRKLWYVPLLFSAYFIIYIGSLILKSVARHKIQLPEKLHELADHEDDHHHIHGHGDRRRHRELNNLTLNVHKAINKKYM